VTRLSRPPEQVIAAHGDEALVTTWYSEVGRRMTRPGWRAILATRPEWRLTRAEAVAVTDWLRRATPEDIEAARARLAQAPLPDPGVADETRTASLEIGDDDDHGLTVSAKGQGLVKSLSDLIREAEIDLSEWSIARWKANTWTTPIKGDDGEPKIVRNWQVTATLEPRRDLEALQHLERFVARETATLIERDNVTSTLIIPDSQHGYRWVGDRRDRLEPMHDEAACAVVVEVARRMQPERIVILGDMADFAELSTKYPRPPELLGTTQATIEALHGWLRSIREAAPEAEIVYVEGNHEARLRAMLIAQAGPVADLRAAGEAEPALSVPRLLGLDGLGVRYVGPYGEDWWADGRVRITHGERVRQRGGATAAAVLADATATTWYGHIHRLEMAQRTIHGPSGPRVITAASPGCLCRIDGAVPGATSRPDWQQGFGLMWYDGGQEWCEVRSIVDGRAVYGGITV